MHNIKILLCLAALLSAQPSFSQSKSKKGALKSDTIALPPAPLCSPVYSTGDLYAYSPAFMPYGFYGGNNIWQLHSGWNASFGMNISAGFGKYAPRGIGFGQDVAVAYSGSFLKRFTWSAGLYASHLDWGNTEATDIGVSGTLGYKATPWLNLYAYAAKSFMPKEQREKLSFMQPYGIPIPKERIGAMAEFKIKKNLKITVSVESQKYDVDPYSPFGTYPRTTGLHQYRSLNQ